MKPFLKWTGGKQWLAPQLSKALQPFLRGTYFEPFAGAAAVFFELQPSVARLTDTNEELIATYRAVRDDVESLIALLSEYPHDEAFFDELKATAPASDTERAARLIYLNKTAFNGIYRVNRDGVFNVPFGRYSNPGICPSERLRQASAALRGITVAAMDFTAAVTSATEGDLVYFDPPYVTGHTNNGFLKYNAHLFSMDDQIMLKDVAAELVSRGVTVAISNADYPGISAMYGGFHISRLPRRSLIGAPADSRGTVTEALISNRELGLIADG